MRPSSSSALLVLASRVSTVLAAYGLTDSFSSGNFFDSVDFFSDGDPTHGHVNYINQGAAWDAGLIANSSGTVYMGVDHKTVQPNGRSSVRVSSKKAWKHGLFILDLAHMPAAVCGTWPAYWFLGTGATWPYAGEIDILEGVNRQSVNDVTLHTGPNCVMTNSGTSATKSTDCNSANGNNGNMGCQTQLDSSSSYGDGFNSGKGGYYAMEWTSDYIKVWFFPRGSAPGDINSATPVPANWPKADSIFSGSGCTIDDKFNAQNFIFDTTFCGDWAGNNDVFGSDSVCNSKGTCNDYVSNNPSDFSNVFWSVNKLQVFQAGAAPIMPPINAVTPASTSTSSTSSMSASDSSTSSTDLSTPIADLINDSATDATSTTTETLTSTTTTYQHPTKTTTFTEGGIFAAIPGATDSNTDATTTATDASIDPTDTTSAGIINATNLVGDILPTDTSIADSTSPLNKGADTIPSGTPELDLAATGSDTAPPTAGPTGATTVVVTRFTTICTLTETATVTVSPLPATRKAKRHAHHGHHGHHA